MEQKVGGVKKDQLSDKEHYMRARLHKKGNISMHQFCLFIKA